MKKLLSRMISALELNVHRKMSPLFILLSVLSVAALLISNIVATKSIRLFDWSVQGFQLSIAASFVVFPFTYIVSDLFSEVYGYAWSRKISWIAFFANLFMVGIIELVIVMPGVDETYSQSFKNVLGSSFGVLFASLTAFMCGDLFNDVVFAHMKRMDRLGTNGSFAFRSILSSLIGEIIDSMVFLPLLYLFIGGYGSIVRSFLQLLAIILIQGTLKTCVEIVLCPLVIHAVNRVRVYEQSLEEQEAAAPAAGVV